MEVHNDYMDLRLKRPVITMGVFDGVHLGHRLLLGRVVEEAGSSSSDSVAVTFDPHPRIVLTGDPSHLRFLTDIDERTELLRETGIGHLVIMPFTRELSQMTAAEFVEVILCRHLGVSHLVTGFNHHFGRRHEGDSNTIITCSQTNEFRVTREGAFVIDGEPVSSSSVRHLLEKGNVRKASQLLGYDYFVRGKVVEGKQIGRNIGFPTANMEPLFGLKLIPGTGVYAAFARIEESGESFMAMVNIGNRPTVSHPGERTTIEAHLIDCSQDLYGKTVRLIFRERLRNEMKFQGLDALAAQLVRDREMTVRVLSV